MNSYIVNSIGKICIKEEGFFIQVDESYLPGLQALEGFSHINVLWWFSDCDNEELRSELQMPQPYQDAPEIMGVFATRSPIRPNPVALTAAEVIHIDHERGYIQIAYIDANDDTPVLDIKPYTPSLDRVETPAVPVWCSKWPKSVEESGDFDWEQVFLF